MQPNRNSLSEPRNEVHAGMISKRSDLPLSQQLDRKVMKREGQVT